MASKKKGKGQVLATLVQFDARGDEDWVRTKYAGIPFDEVPMMTRADYRPYGGTPLLDAVGETIASLDRDMEKLPDAVHIAFVLDESGSMSRLIDSVIDGYNEFVNSLKGVKPDGKAGRAMLVVFTDGQENRSREVTRASVAAMVAEREARGNFETVYLGANQDAWQGAAVSGMSTKRGKVMNYEASDVGTRSAMSNVAMRTNSFVADSSDYANLAETMGDIVAEDAASLDASKKATSARGFAMRGRKR